MARVSVLLFVVLVVASFQRGSSQSNISSTPSFCRNTVQGRSLQADENGYVCRVQDSDFESGCCPKIQEPYQCYGCNVTAKCCNAYEYCVACCLNPNQTSNDVARKVKVAHHASAGFYKDGFDFCLGRCRHDSRSVVHENAYATESHHCFSLPTNLSSQAIRMVDDNSLESLAIVISRQGQSCETACKLSGLTCQLSKLPAVNKCSVLQKYFNCRGPCVASIDQPAQVSPSAARHMHPGACYFTTQASALSCEAYNKHWRRLCPCA
ncbi:hypothetical protein GOP47_0015178 [Adiantum capillus-veneris]|uniref:SREBP regulating gene protein n=1 Tax=Adiantum capillus-veneris TaxID=13818 RepID=A0A9D4UN34_ADICA|nr:hypothetical protein GOP47_0014825 [Adiantum capillus-veneris]KAI5070835.1 hypothetical protein GOP47_0015178 [Adiantum capillus-veneris]